MRWKIRVTARCAACGTTWEDSDIVHTTRHVFAMLHARWFCLGCDAELAPVWFVVRLA